MAVVIWTLAAIYLCNPWCNFCMTFIKLFWSFNSLCLIKSAVVTNVWILLLFAS